MNFMKSYEISLNCLKKSTPPTSHNVVHDHKKDLLDKTNTNKFQTINELPGLFISKAAYEKVCNAFLFFTGHHRTS